MFYKINVMKLVTKWFEFLGNLIVALFVCLIGIIEIAIKGVIPIWNGQKKGHVWFGIFNQPFVVLFTFIPISSQLDFLLIPENRLFWIILILFEIIILTFIINSVIELIFNLRNKEDVYKDIQELQKYSNNYVLIIISLLALYVAAYPESTHINNLELLIMGSIYSLSTISSDIYRVFIYSKGSVPELAKKVRLIFK